MRFRLNSRATSVVGLSLENGRVRAVQMVRSKGRLEAVRTAGANLALDLLNPESELVGREIANRLDAAGIRERTCVLAVPSPWVIGLCTATPGLGPEDLDSFLQIAAERGFPCEPRLLQIARSTLRSAKADHCTQLAVRRDQLDRLVAVARAAGLRPVSIALGLAALPGVLTAPKDGCILVDVHSRGASFIVTAGGGIAAARASEAFIASETGREMIDDGALARELRITVEQLPGDLRAELRHVHLFGPEASVGPLAERLAAWAEGAGLAIERTDVPEGGCEEAIARAVAIEWLQAGRSRVEFLPPQRSRWAVVAARYRSRRFGLAAAGATAALAVTVAAFGWQEFRAWTLRSEWGRMEGPVAGLRALQDRIHSYRPWYDHSVPDLQILARVTQCFPQNGSLSAKSFGAHRTGTTTTVSVSGTARDGQALLRAQDNLRKSKEIEGLKVETISGKMPAQFTLTFRWVGNPGS